MKPDNRFRSGSVLKTFVAVTVMQLVEEGKLSLDDTLPTVLPHHVIARFPDSSRITVRMLLNHTSGIPDIKKANFEQLVAANPHRIWSIDYFLNIAAAEPPAGMPGQHWAYSNANYILLGLIIERATGESWRAAVRERVIDRLHLEHTSLPEAGDLSIGSNAAHGYDPVAGKLADFTAVDPSIFGAAGGASLITTTDDLRHFIHALFAGDLVKRATTLHQMLNFVPAQDVGGMNGYGLGIERYQFPGGVQAYGHLGTVAGYLAFVAHLPAQGIDVAMAVNSRDGAGALAVLLPALKLMIAKGQG
jgi:D-alanyl-D-alanine carboxypeptidase